MSKRKNKISIIVCITIADAELHIYNYTRRKK